MGILERFTSDVKSIKAEVEIREKAKQQQMQEREAEQLALIVEGAPTTDSTVEVVKFLKSNQRHLYVDGLCGVVVYTFSALQQIAGQSNALILLSMWTAGTTYFLSFANRKYVMQQVDPLYMYHDTAKRGKQPSNSNEEAKAEKAEPSAKSTEVAAKDKLITPSTAAASATFDMGNALEQMGKSRASLFQLETVASWVWMLSAMQQFKIHKTMKWSGYCSWTALCFGVYFTFRHAYNVFIE